MPNLIHLNHSIVERSGITVILNTELFRRTVDQFSWQKTFLNNSVNKKANIFNETILNILLY